MNDKTVRARTKRLVITVVILLPLLMGMTVQPFGQECDKVDQSPTEKSDAPCTLSRLALSEETLTLKKNTDCASRLIVLQLNTLDNLIWETAPLHKPGNHESAYSSIPILLMKESFLI